MELLSRVDRAIAEFVTRAGRYPNVVYLGEKEIEELRGLADRLDMKPWMYAAKVFGRSVFEVKASSHLGVGLAGKTK
jgi:hypothetical protein